MQCNGRARHKGGRRILPLRTNVIMRLQQIGRFDRLAVPLSVVWLTRLSARRQRGRRICIAENFAGS